MLYIHVGNKVVTYSSGVDKVYTYSSGVDKVYTYSSGVDKAITLLIYDKKDFHIKIKCKSTHD